MPAFRYEAKNVDGHNVVGLVTAEDERLALRDLRRRGLTTFSLSPESSPAAVRIPAGRKAGAAENILFLKQMALLLEAGVTLDQALRSMAAARAYRSLRPAIENLHRNVRQGAALSSALRRSFPDLKSYVHQLVEAGELTGQLRQAIADAAAQMEAEHRFAREIRNTLTYPAILALAGVGAVLFVFVFVVPRFMILFKSRMESLPWLSRTVLTLGTFVNGHLAILLILAGAGAIAAARLLQMPGPRAAFYHMMLGLPFIGNWLKEAETGRWASMLATLLGNRVPLMQSLTLSRGIVRSVGPRASLSQVERAVRSGSTLAAALEDYTMLSPTIINLVDVGEKSGGLAAALRSAALLSEENGRDRMKRCLALVEPLAILVIGAAVGLIAIAIFLAVNSLSNIPT